jgi:hypothetical protein
VEKKYKTERAVEKMNKHGNNDDFSQACYLSISMYYIELSNLSTKMGPYYYYYYIYIYSIIRERRDYEV